ncbi:MAG: DUF6562 domain-containing protein [Candidatus Cryptobacteroides sp.]
MKSLRTIMAALLFLSFSSCAVHEFPDPSLDWYDVDLHLLFDTDIPVYQEIERDFAKSKAVGVTLQRRYIIKAYRSDVRDEAGSWVFYRPAGECPDTTVTLHIQDGNYRLLLWSDFIEDGSESDYFYLTSDFADIRLPDRDGYKGATDARETFRGDVQIVSGTKSVDVGMQRPMAKYIFITTDLGKFMNNERQKAESRVEEQDASNSPDSPVRIPGVNLQNYGVRFIYSRYMSYSFNMFANRPSDSWTGISFETDMDELGGDSALVGFDYIFVNSHDTSIYVSVEVFDRRDGEVLARIPAMDVPLRRNHKTIVRGDFLSVKAGNVVGIDPGFDGDFNIEIR